MNNIDNLLKYQDNGDIDIDTMDPADVVRRIYCKEWFTDADTDLMNINQVYNELHSILGEDFELPKVDQLCTVEVMSNSGMRMYRPAIDILDDIREDDYISLATLKLWGSDHGTWRYNSVLFNKTDVKEVSDKYSKLDMQCRIIHSTKPVCVLPWKYLTKDNKRSMCYLLINER